MADGFLVRLSEGLDQRGVGLDHAISRIILFNQTAEGIDIPSHQLAIPHLIGHIIILEGSGIEIQTSITHDPHQFSIFYLVGSRVVSLEVFWDRNKTRVIVRVVSSDQRARANMDGFTWATT